jgi:hypothetical protein
MILGFDELGIIRIKIYHCWPVIDKQKILLSTQLLLTRLLITYLGANEFELNW